MLACTRNNSHASLKVRSSGIWFCGIFVFLTADARISPIKQMEFHDFGGIALSVLSEQSVYLWFINFCFDLRLLVGYSKIFFPT